MMRKGAARGTGAGYRNLPNFPKDPMVHRQSAMGMKQPQTVMMPMTVKHGTFKAFPNLHRALVLENQKEINEALERIKTDEGLKERMKWEHKTYKKNEREQFTKFLTNKYQKELDEKIQMLEAINNAPNLPNPLVVTVEWKKSRMWGSNPRAHTNYGFESDSIGGCGYDKLSTALAEALNSCLPVMKEVVKLKEKRMNTPEGKKLRADGENTFNRQVLGYGSGYGMIPHFEGGVGVESHRTIIENAGFVFEHPVSTDNTDVFIIRNKGA
jgi:hypothetical protein